MKHELTIDRIPLRNYGVWFDGASVYNNGNPNKTTISIPGRNGDLILLNEKFDNLNIDYKALIHKGFSSRFKELTSFLYSDLSYRRIEDSHIPNHFRMGHITGNLNPSDIFWNSDAGMFTIRFNCKPQLFLTDGEQPQTFTANDVIINPTAFKALPLINVYGTGTFYIGDYTVKVLAHSGIPYITLDCEAQEAYYEQTNCNQYVQITDDTFPKIDAGEVTIRKGNGISKLEIIPRWWTL